MMTVLILVFCSGFVGLVYEVLWMRQLGLLFGSTAQAAAATLASLFAGFSAGSWFWGRRAARTADALRLYAGLQAGVAATAGVYFVILAIYYRIYPLVYQQIHSRPLLLAVKVLLTLLLVFPPAFFMGGTLPAIGQHLVTRREAFGTTAARVYGINTLGATLGAFLAGFFFPLWLGFRLTFLGAMAVSATVSILAFRLARRPAPRRSARAKRAPRAARPADAVARPRPESALRGTGRWAILPLCFVSGFGFLALEVLWTRVFNQVLENSVYTYAAVLVIALLCLSAGALISARLARTRVSPYLLLTLLTLLGGIAIALTPFVVMRLTNGLEVLAWRGSWASYVGAVFSRGFLAFGPPALLAGTVFPLLMKAEERHAVSAGRSLGRMAAVNTVGAILGALICGFVLLDTLGLWQSMRLIAVLYFGAAIALPLTWNARGLPLKAIGALFLVLVFTGLSPAHLPITSFDPLRGTEEVVETWEGRDVTVAVVRDRYGLSLKINSHYGLGSTAAAPQARLQNDIPLMVWPQTESIFFLGMGTGITAGSSLGPRFPNTARVVACEIVPEVIAAAEKHFTDFEGRDYTSGLFSDPRVTILADDGRHYLMASGDRFDMINADLFVPFRIGDGSLYSREHFQRVKASLEPGGVFVQWLPLYMMTEYEFGVIARTMLEVFDPVSLWRGNFQVGEEIVALVGHTEPAPLQPSRTDRSADRRASVAGRTPRDVGRLALPMDTQSILLFYGGNVTAARELFEDYPVNRDDRPLIEYMAPRTYRRATDGPIPWFVGPRIIRLIEELQRRTPPDRDPLLAERSPAARQLPAAGVAFHRARLWGLVGRPEDLHDAWDEFVQAWTGQDPRPVPDRGPR